MLKPLAQMRSKELPKEPKLKKVYICSPFRPTGRTEKEKRIRLRSNIRDAQTACRFAVNKGYIPYAPHLYFPQFLLEEDSDEREMGILLGLTWLARCDELWIIGDRISGGMEREISAAEKWSIPIRQFARGGAALERHLAVLFGEEIFDNDYTVNSYDGDDYFNEKEDMSYDEF